MLYRKRAKEWYITNRDNPNRIARQKKHMRDWYRWHREEHKAYMREYYHKNREKHKIRKMTNRLYPIKPTDVCSKCGNRDNLQHHHTTEPYEVDEFIIVCKDCQGKYHRKITTNDVL